MASVLHKRIQNIAFRSGLGITLLALYDVIVDVRFAHNSTDLIKQGDLILSYKNRGDNIEQLKNRNILMIEPIADVKRFTKIEAIAGDMVDLNSAMRFMVPNGSFYAQLSVNREDKMLDLTNFHAVSLIQAVPVVRLWPTPGVL